MSKFIAVFTCTKQKEGSQIDKIYYFLTRLGRLNALCEGRTAAGGRRATATTGLTCGLGRRSGGMIFWIRCGWFTYETWLDRNPGSP